MRWRVALLVGLVMGLAVGTAAAQQVTITAPAPRGERSIDGILDHGLQYDITRPDDSRYVPLGPRVHYDPAYIEPLSVPTETGRMGVAAWTAPTAAMGGTDSGAREITGYFAIGFAFEWGAQPIPKRPTR
jgi:hypothetical protein